VFMLTLIGGERQRSSAMVRWLGRCLALVREASGEASAPRIAPIGGGKLEFGGYLGFGGFLTCSRKFALYAALYIGVFR
jgi:hypothetical protein